MLEISNSCTCSEEYYCDGYCCLRSVSITEEMLGPHRGPGQFYIEGESIGWQNKSGWLTLPTDISAEDWLFKVTVNTRWTIVFDETPKGDTLEGTACILSWKLYHHDSPMGEFYSMYFIPQEWIDIYEESGEVKEIWGIGAEVFQHILEI